MALPENTDFLIWRLPPFATGRLFDTRNEPGAEAHGQAASHRFAGGSVAGDDDCRTVAFGHLSDGSRVGLAVECVKRSVGHVEHPAGAVASEFAGVVYRTQCQCNALCAEQVGYFFSVGNSLEGRFFEVATWAFCKYEYHYVRECERREK